MKLVLGTRYRDARSAEGDEAFGRKKTDIQNSTEFVCLTTGRDLQIGINGRGASTLAIPMTQEYKQVVRKGVFSSYLTAHVPKCTA